MSGIEGPGPTGGSSAPANEDFVTFSTEAGLPNSRVLTAGTNITVSTATPGQVIVNAAAGANPTASIGLAAVNGVAATFLRSDGAPALDQAIVPTWTGAHTWSATGTFSALLSAGRVNVTSSSATTVGIYRPATNSLGLLSNSTERLRIDASGTWLLGGSSAGTSGQVLTSSGAGAAPTWTTVSGGTAFTSVRKASDETISSDQTVSDDAALVFTSVAAGTYAFDGYVVFTSTNAAGFSCSLHTSQALVTSWVTYLEANQANTTFEAIVAENPRTAATGQNFTVDDVNIKTIQMTGTLIIPSSTNLAFQWAQATSTAVNTVVYAGSWMRLMPIA